MKTEKESKSTFRLFGLTLEDIEEAFKLIKRHGPIPILSIWLLVDHGRINRLENNLYNCYKQGYKHSELIHTDAPSMPKATLFAVIPNEQKLIESDHD